MNTNKYREFLEENFLLDCKHLRLGQWFAFQPNSQPKDTANTSRAQTSVVRNGSGRLQTLLIRSKGVQRLKNWINCPNPLVQSLYPGRLEAAIVTRGKVLMKGSKYFTSQHDDLKQLNSIAIKPIFVRIFQNKTS